MNGRVSRVALLGASVALALILQVAGIRPAASQVTTVAALYATAVPRDPWDARWNDVRPAELALSAQLITPPKGGTRDRVTVRALHDRREIVVLLEWADATADERIGGVDSYSDAAALQFPAAGGTGVPPLCMGSPTALVNVWQWKAWWQTDASGGIAATYPRARVDSYPFADEAVFAPARLLADPVAQLTHASPVEELRAAQYGTLTPAASQSVGGIGAWRDGTWRVLFWRTLEASADDATPFAVGSDVDAAAALWDGSSRERDGMKSVSAFFTLRPMAAPLPAPPLPYFPWLLLWPIGTAALLAVIFAIDRLGKRSA